MGAGKSKGAAAVQAPAVDPNNLPVYSMDEVQKHKTRDDCWIVLHGKVYNVSGFIDEHPGGDVVLDVAGADGTAAFEEQSHSGYAKSQLPQFLIGRIAD